MGVRGLTSYISQNSRLFYEPLQLHDCTLVIDGCSLACQLYIESMDYKYMYGGDYDSFAQKVEDFFSVLEQCNVIPVVVIDGGYEGRKLNTILSRFRDRINAAKICNPSNQRRNVVFPLLFMESFKQTLSKKKVKFVQTDFEADHEIAAIARSLKSPVLSNDSDFYISDVLYVPFPTLNLSPVKTKQSSCVKYYLSCEVFKVERFISNFGQFDKRLLPLISILLGNDYVSSSFFIKFVEQIMVTQHKKTSPQHSKLSSIFNWLKTETLESATAKMLNHLKRKQRTFVKQQIELAISANSCVHSQFTSYLGLDTVKSELPTDKPASEKDSPGPGTLSSEKGMPESTEGSDDDSDFDIDGTNEGHSSSSLFPLWLREKFRKGEVSTSLSDIFHMHLYFCYPQVEDFSCHDSHSLSFPILTTIFGILQHDTKVESPENIDGQLTCYSRGATASCQIIELQPTKELPGFSLVPSISTIPSLPFSVRKNLFFSSLFITDVVDIDLLESFNEDWKLFASVVVFWARTASFPEITYNHLHSLIICMIALGVVDKKVGRIRHEKNYVAAKKAHASKIINEKNSDMKAQEEGFLSHISESECLSFAESLLQFHQFKSKLVFRPIMHVFAQFQACLHTVMSLNCILEFPVPQCQLPDTFSGSLIYAVCVNLKRKNDVGSYIKNLMGATPSLYQLYKDLLDKFASLLPDTLNISKQGKHKTRTQNCMPTSDGNLSHQGNDASSSLSVELDTNNKFSLLSTVV